jgi:hypothetical protein
MTLRVTGFIAHLVDRGVGRIASAAKRVEQYLASRLTPQARFEARSGGIVERHTLSRSCLVLQSDTGPQMDVNA